MAFAALSASVSHARSPENAPAKNFVVDTGLANSTVVVQLTTDNYQAGTGWTAAYACDAGFHGTSSLNNTSNPVASNLLIVQTNASGQFCVISYQQTDLVVDLLGTVGGASIGTPGRAFDSRQGGQPATDRRIGVSSPNANVVLQVTTDNFGNGGTGWTAVYNCDEGFRGTSSLNNKANPVASNTVIAKTDSGGAVCIKSLYPSDHVVDVLGTIGDASIHSPDRVFDSRRPGIAPGATPGAVNVGIPNAVAVLQVTTDNYVGGSGWTAVFGCQEGFHGTSSLNNTTNPIASNLVIVPTDANGNVCLQSYRPTDVIVDVIGTLTNSAIHTPDRILDTRKLNPPGQLANPGDAKNCTDFATYADAKAWFDAYYPYYGDIANLDEDHDGTPCEMLLGPPTTQPPAPTPPGNPGDTKNCGDFANYAQAKAWFDTYFPYYGDVAKLDQDNDGIPCETLPGAP